MTSDAPMIECRNLRRTFQRGGPLRRWSEFVAVSDISFDIRPGSIFGLLGPNGAGKTTTVRMLSTLLLPTTGSARVAGFDVASQPREVRRRTGLALGGDRGLFGRLTAEQNPQYFGAINQVERYFVVRVSPLDTCATPLRRRRSRTSSGGRWNACGNPTRSSSPNPSRSCSNHFSKVSCRQNHWRSGWAPTQRGEPRLLPAAAIR